MYRGGPCWGRSRSSRSRLDFFQNPDDLEQDVGAGRLVDEAIVGDPDALAAQLDDLGALAELPGRRHLAEPLDERGQLGRGIGAGIGLVRDQAVARLEVEAPRLALRAPAQLGVEAEVLAVQERGQEPARPGGRTWSWR